MKRRHIPRGLFLRWATPASLGLLLLLLLVLLLQLLLVLVLQLCLRLCIRRSRLRLVLPWRRMSHVLRLRAMVRGLASRLGLGQR